MGTEGSVLPSLIFVDMMMPDMNGFEFLDAFEKLPSTVIENIAACDWSEFSEEI